MGSLFECGVSNKLFDTLTDNDLQLTCLFWDVNYENETTVLNFTIVTTNLVFYIFFQIV